MSSPQRLKKAREDKGFSQTELASQVGIHYTQIGRYETKGAQPSADILSKLANTLEVSSNFLTKGISDDLADSSLTDKELLTSLSRLRRYRKQKDQWLRSSWMPLLLRISSGSWRYKNPGERPGFVIILEVNVKT